MQLKLLAKFAPHLAAARQRAACMVEASRVFLTFSDVVCDHRDAPLLAQVPRELGLGTSVMVPVPLVEDGVVLKQGGFAVNADLNDKVRFPCRTLLGTPALS